MNRNFLFIILIYSFTLGLTTSQAWVYPEHREIALIAVQGLNASYRSELDNLWTQARKGYEYRLSENVIEPDQGTSPEFIDYAAWPAIAGDHSCSAENMLHNIDKSLKGNNTQSFSWEKDAFINQIIF